MFCKNCAATYANDASNCPYCGSDNPEFKTQSQLAQDEALTLKKESYHQGVNKTLRLFTLTTCTIFIIILTIFGGLTLYYEHLDEWQKQAAVKGKNYEENLAHINRCLDQKDYLKAYTIAYATSPTYDVSESYPDIAEELKMIDCYISFIRDLQPYIVNDCNFEDLYFSSYSLETVHMLYTTTPNSTRSAAIKDVLCESVDLYLKYYYRLTDEEIENLKSASDFYDYEIEGTTDYDYIIKERMHEYEKDIQ